MDEEGLEQENVEELEKVQDNTCRTVLLLLFVLSFSKIYLVSPFFAGILFFWGGIQEIQLR